MPVSKTQKQVLLFSFAFSLLLLFGLFSLLLSAGDDWKQLKAYRQSPFCLSGTPTSAGPTPCVFLTEHVVSKRQEEGSRGTVNDFVELQNGQAAPQEAEVVDRSCWDLLTAGDSVTAQTWHRHIMTVTAHHRHSLTADNPVYVTSSDRVLFFLLTPLTLFFVTATVLTWKKVFRKSAARI